MKISKNIIKATLLASFSILCIFFFYSTVLIKENNNDIYETRLLAPVYIEIDEKRKLKLKKLILPYSQLIYDDKSRQANQWVYIEKLKNFLFIFYPYGKIFFIDLDEDKLSLKKIDTNLHDFFKNIEYSAQTIKDIEIVDKKFYVSFVNRKRENCFNTSIATANINFDSLNFKLFFDPEMCLGFKNEKIGQIKINASGGRIEYYNDEKIFFTIGNYLSPPVAQNDKKIFGKILEINLKNKQNKIISKGHRNPQGLLYLKDKKILISSEHADFGGDEINILNLNKNLISNYGYPISSYGNHYPSASNEYKEKATLYKSHSKYNFVEPIKYWTPSVGPSQLVEINNKEIIMSSLKAESLFFLKFNNNYSKIISEKNIKIGQRIRDLIFDKKNNQYILLLESEGGYFNKKKNILEKLEISANKKIKKLFFPYEKSEIAIVRDKPLTIVFLNIINK